MFLHPFFIGSLKLLLLPSNRRYRKNTKRILSSPSFICFASFFFAFVLAFCHSKHYLTVPSTSQCIILGHYLSNCQPHNLPPQAGATYFHFQHKMNCYILLVVIIYHKIGRDIYKSFSIVLSDSVKKSKLQVQSGIL